MLLINILLLNIFLKGVASADAHGHIVCGNNPSNTFDTFKAVVKDIVLLAPSEEEFKTEVMFASKHQVRCV